MAKRKSPNKVEPEIAPSDDQQVIVDNISEALLTFARAADAVTHETAEKTRQNKKKAGPPEDEPDTVTAEVVDDEKPSGAADTDTEPIDAEVISNPDVKVQIINNPTIVSVMISKAQECIFCSAKKRTIPIPFTSESPKRYRIGSYSTFVITMPRRKSSTGQRR